MGSTDLHTDLSTRGRTGLNIFSILPIFLCRMSGYEDAFFQTGRNSAEARFWRLKIHEEVDRRQTKSSIAFDESASSVGGEEDREISPSPDYGGYAGNKAHADSSSDYRYSYATPMTDYSKDYRYTYPNPRDRSMSIVSTMSTRMTQFSASKDYQYSYPGEHEEEEDEQEEKGGTDSNKNKEAEEEEDREKEECETRDEGEKYFLKEKASLVTLCEKHEEQSAGHISSRFY